jgi:putative flippase GtrA
VTLGIRKLARYGTASAISTSVSLTVLGALVYTRAFDAAWANVVATAVGTIPSFELNRRWVWGKTGRRSVAAEVVPFCALSFAGLALSTAAVTVVARGTTAAGLGAGMRTLLVEAANVSAFGSLWVAQFVFLDRVLFARRHPDAAALSSVPADLPSAA